MRRGPRRSTAGSSATWPIFTSLPTARARENLLREGIGRDRIVVTGNTGIDALLWVSALLDGRGELRARVEKILGGRFAEHQRVILMTGHRRESFDGGLERICRAMARIALRRDVAIVFPVHPNPNVRRATEPLQRHDNVFLVEPVDYPELVFLLKRPVLPICGLAARTALNWPQRQGQARLFGGLTWTDGSMQLDPVLRKHQHPP
jgi:UDP-N-acetylglucosamine 2-epimerase